MPYYVITGAYLQPGEGPVEPYGWNGEANTPELAVEYMQDECHESMETEDEQRENIGDLIYVIDIWEVHADDVAAHERDHHAFVRMRPVQL